MSDDKPALLVIREALDLGLQAWRTTPVRQKFLDAFDAVAKIEHALTAHAIEQYEREHQP